MWTTYTNERGKWETDGVIHLLVEPSQKWIDENTPKINLDQYKQEKINTLSNQCEQVIEAGFTSANGHIYRTNRDDQLNFLGKFNQLTSDETITEVYWKTEDAGYLPHTREEWLTVYFEGISHKEQTLFKLDGLRNQVKAATTQEDIDSVVW